MSVNNTKSYYRKKYQKKNSEEIQQKIEKKKFIISIKNLLCQGKLNKALSEVEYYLTKYPNDSYGLFQKGSILTSMWHTRHSDMRYLEEAENIFRKIIELDLDSKYSSLYQLGVLYSLKKDFKKAEYYYRTNIETSPYPEIYSRIELSFLECLKGNYQNAELLTNGYYDREINGITPLNIFIRFNNIPQEGVTALKLQSAQIKVITQNIEEARGILDQLDLKKCSSFLQQQYHLLMGKIENLDKNYELAMQHLRGILRGPKTNLYWKAQLEMIRSYAKLGQNEEALYLCDEIIEKSLQYQNDALKAKGNVYQWNHQYEEAKEQYLKMNNEEGTYNIGKMKFKQKDYEEALTYFNMGHFENQVLKVNNDFYKVITLLKLGRYEEAYRASFLVESDYLPDLLKREFNAAKFYLKAKTDRYINRENLSYIQSQIIDYDVEKAIGHINNAHQKDNATAKFYEHRDIEQLVLELPDLLEKEDTVIFRNLFFEIYEIPYKNLGSVNGKKTNALRVVMLPDNYHVITMFPTIIEKNNRHMNSFSVQKGKTRKSQIDKFNEKYGKK